MPADVTAADILATRLVLDVADLDGVASALQGAGAQFVSDGVVGGDEGRSLLARDLDGHLLEVKQGRALPEPAKGPRTL